jgi:phage tail-like protein
MTLVSSLLYRFATAAQWNTCLFTGADRSAAALDRVRPAAPFSDESTDFSSPGGWAPALSALGEISWRDTAGALRRCLIDDPVPAGLAAPQALAQATRMVVTADGLWAPGVSGSTLECFEPESLSRRLVVDLHPAQVVDLDRDGPRAVLVLLRRGAAYECVGVDQHGRITPVGALRGAPTLSALANLPEVGQLLVLAADGRTLYGFARGEPGANLLVNLATLRPCFTAGALASDGLARILVGGTDGAEFGGAATLLVLDVNGLKVDELPIAEAPTGLAASASLLLVTSASGLRVHGTAQTASNRSAVVCSVITPVLYAPPGVGTSRWLRAELQASLPPGTSIEVSYAASADAALAAQATALAADQSLPASIRTSRLRTLLASWSTPTVFQGSASTQPAATRPPLAAPLFEASAPNLWVSISLGAAPGASLPELTELLVRYSGHSLLEQLPMIYRRDAANPGSFTRAFVGVLEATTQETDRRIGALGSLIHPDTAPPDWLDFVATWLGLPWDDGLSEAQKRAIMHAAPVLAAQRGTRAGLAALLDCLVPGTPQRYRIVDLDVDIGFAQLGGGGCAGSPLPAMLSGLPDSAAVLSTRTILGRARLPCPGEVPDTTTRFLGQLRVVITASAQEQRAWAPWIRALLTDMVPAATRLEIEWRSPARSSTALTSDGLPLLPAPAPHLGTDAITGYARLPGARPQTL